MSQNGNCRIITRHDGNGISTLPLNHPQKYNAMSSAMLDALERELSSKSIFIATYW